MKHESRNHEEELGGQLLASVSRSFYLTLKALPRELREPISLAYLLARTADTIADTAAIDASTRLDCLAQYDVLLQAEARDDGAEVRLATQLEARFLPLQTDAAEATLMRRFRDAFTWLHSMEPSVLVHIRAVLKTIVHGQRLDIERFPGVTLRSLQTAGELDDYTYLVAGCVGEFWTKLCFERLPDAFVAGTSHESAIACGIRFGKGLQLVNVLRDIGKDARLGRCYIPQEEWETQGLALLQIQQRPSVLRSVCAAWRLRCRDHLDAALQYVQSLHHGTLRYATALPLLLAVRTLAKIEGASDSELEVGVKISRLEVTKVLAQAALTNSPTKLAELYHKLSR